MQPPVRAYVQARRWNTCDCRLGAVPYGCAASCRALRRDPWI